LGQPGVEVLLPPLIFVGFEIVACIVPGFAIEWPHGEEQPLSSREVYVTVQIKPVAPFDGVFIAAVEALEGAAECSE